MAKRLGFISLWLVATLASIAVGVEAVTSVRQQVADTPAPLGALAATTTTTTAPPVGTVTTTRPVTTTAAEPATVTTTSMPASTTTTTAPPVTVAAGVTTTSSTTTTSTTVPETSTTVAAVEPGEQSYSLVGGWVRISVEQDRVDLIGAAPLAGYDMEIEDAGPQQVEVEFSNGSHTSSFRARWADGALDVERNEEDG